MSASTQSTTIQRCSPVPDLAALCQALDAPCVAETAACLAEQARAEHWSKYS